MRVPHRTPAARAKRTPLGFARRPAACVLASSILHGARDREGGPSTNPAASAATTSATTTHAGDRPRRRPRSSGGSSTGRSCDGIVEPCGGMIEERGHAARARRRDLRRGALERPSGATSRRAGCAGWSRAGRDRTRPACVWLARRARRDPAPRREERRHRREAAQGALGYARRRCRPVAGGRVTSRRGLGARGPSPAPRQSAAPDPSASRAR